MKKKLGDMIRFAIEMKDMKQKDVALALNMSPQALSSYIQNTRMPDIETLVHIMVYLNMDANETLQMTTNLKTRIIMDFKEEIIIRNYRRLDKEHKEFALFVLERLPKIKD